MDLKHDVYTITNIMILRIFIILFLKSAAPQKVDTERWKTDGK